MDLLFVPGNRNIDRRMIVEELNLNNVPIPIRGRFSDRLMTIAQKQLTEFQRVRNQQPRAALLPTSG